MPRPEIIRCPTCGRRQRRSSEQNKLLWVLLHEISESIKPMGQQHSAESWLMYFKSKFLGADDIRLPDGKVVVRPFSSSELDKPEFADFLDQIQAWAAERGIVLAE